jgi:hypothetical protein
MARLYDLARMNTATTGTGSITLGGAVTGFLNFSQAGAVNGDVLTYAIEDGVNREIGRGTLSGTTLTRDTVLRSTNSNAKISLSGTAQVFIAAAAEDIAPQTAPEQSTVRTTLYAAPYDALAALNLIINGAMEISQEIGTSTKSLSVGDNSLYTYNLDQWFSYKLASNNWNVRQVADGPVGWSRCLDYNAAATQAIGATHFYSLGTFIEGTRLARLGFGTASAGKITLGFWCKSDSTGTAWVTFYNGGLNRCYRASYSISSPNTWEYKTITIDADQSGVWATDTGRGLWISWCIGSGASAQSATVNTWTSDGTVNGGGPGQTNFLPSASNYFRLTGVFLVPTADVPSAARSIIFRGNQEDELDRCMRHFETSYDLNVAVGTAAAVGFVDHGIVLTSGVVSATQQGRTVFFKKIKRASPSITFYSPPTGASGKMRDINAGADINGATGTIGTRAFAWLAAATAAQTWRINFHWSANSRM